VHVYTSFHVPYILLIDGEQRDVHNMRSSVYQNADVVFILFCVESKKTLDHCLQYWAPEISHFCNEVLIILVGTSHCYLPHLNIDEPPSNRCVSIEEGKEAAKKIGKMTLFESVC